jgi:hypothetical protein
MGRQYDFQLKVEKLKCRQFDVQLFVLIFLHLLMESQLVVTFFNLSFLLLDRQ